MGRTTRWLAPTASCFPNRSRSPLSDDPTGRFLRFPIAWSEEPRSTALNPWLPRRSGIVPINELHLRSALLYSVPKYPPKPLPNERVGHWLCNTQLVAPVCQFEACRQLEKKLCHRPRGNSMHVSPSNQAPKEVWNQARWTSGSSSLEADVTPHVGDFPTLAALYEDKRVNIFGKGHT